MKQKILHFIPHAHWDREWYMSFENHRYRLVKLIDSILDTLESNPEYKSYHLDGQTIILDDYIEVRPQMLERVKKHISEGRIKYGPAYVLPDEFLISGEAHIRNYIYGLKSALRYGGKPIMIGYFPDAFGNISQMPQILQGFGIDVAYYGRGITAVGFNNTVLGENSQCASEMIWQSPDGSRVMGVLFSCWYNNAAEIPDDKEKAIKRVTEIRNNAAVTASTPYLLMMNGSDHQPVQSELPQILQKIGGEFPDILIMSDLEAYANELKPYIGQFKTITGELTSQYSDGWWTLANTASSRIYLKQMNHTAQRSLSCRAEPVSVMNMLIGGNYNSDILNLSWKTLMQNHPHDSICGCSVDDVHREMVVRFQKSIDISDALTKDKILQINDVIDTSFCDVGELPLIVYNTAIKTVNGKLCAEIDFDENDSIEPDMLMIKDENNHPVLCSFEKVGITFKFVLPDDSFRRAQYVNRFKVWLNVPDIPAMGYKVLKVLKTANEERKMMLAGSDFAENALIRVDFNTDGTIRLLDKRSGKVFDKLHIFEDTGDIGDEYVYRQTEDNKSIFTNQNVKLELIHCGAERVVFKIIYNMVIPENVDYEKKLRSEQLKTLEIVSYITIWENCERIDIKTEFVNDMRNHRLRILFPTNLNADSCLADGQFDHVERKIRTNEVWENPSNCQRQQSFVTIMDGDVGLMIANRGLPEYEILRDDKNTIALTLLRSVSHLGDWGIFPTPDAQCISSHITEYSIIPYSKERYCNACDQAYDYTYEYVFATQSNAHKGILPVQKSFMQILKGDGIAFSALKKAENSDDVVLRIYNTVQKTQNTVIQLDSMFTEAYLLNLKEEKLNRLKIENHNIHLEIGAKKIITISLK